MPFKKGHKFSTGHGGNPRGRDPKWFREWCRDAVSSERRLKRLEEMLDKGNHDEFMAVWKHLQQFGYGKAAENINISGKITLEDLIKDDGD